MISRFARNFSNSIKSIKGREIIDSRGNPTVEAEVTTTKGVFRAAVPSGASTGIYEANELRDQDPKRYSGKGVQKAVSNINSVIAPALVGLNCAHQNKIDKLMVETLDGTSNQYGWLKGKLGANSILAVSLAVARAGAEHKKLPLYEYIADLSGRRKGDKFITPVPSLNVINGGKHAGNLLAMQEFMILPTGFNSFKEALQGGAEVYHALQKIIKKKYGIDATNVGDEGGFAPPTRELDSLELLKEAIFTAGHEGKIDIGLDCASSEFYVPDLHLYDLDFKGPINNKKLITKQQLLEVYKGFCQNHSNIVSIEDPFDQDDWEGWNMITKQLGDKVQIVGDDLLVTNPKRIKMALDKQSCNALLLKVNQIGSLTESIQAAQDSFKNGWGVMVSHRSGETEDSFIADLAVGLQSGEIKTGAPCRSERLAKYNQILRIEEQLGSNAVYAGKNFRNPFHLI